MINLKNLSRILPLPKQLRRIDDGEIFSQNVDGTYSMDKMRKEQPATFYRYSFERLMHDCGGHFEVVERVKD